MEEIAGVLQVLPNLPRSDGRIALSFVGRGTRSVLADMHQSGNARARFPGRGASGGVDGIPEAVLLNTAGGLTGGDKLAVDVAVGAGASAVITTIAAEKVYRSLGSDTEITNRLHLEHGASLAWLPQATIAFDNSRLSRTTHVDMAADATFLGLEILIMGRTAMAETLDRGHLRDVWRIRRGGRLVWADNVRLDEPITSSLSGPAALAGARAVATLVLVTPDAEHRLDGARQALAAASSEWGASAWDGLLTARLAARDGHIVIADVTRLVEYLRGRSMPRTWQF